MITLLALVAVGAISYGLRVAPLLLVGRVRISAAADRVIRHAAAAGMVALLVGALRHGMAGGPSVAVVVATVVSFGSAMRGASMPHVVLIGGAIYVALVVLGS